jgi:hypothetical protein
MNDLIIHQPTNVTLEVIRQDEQNFPRLCSYRKEDALSSMTKLVFMAFMFRGYQVDDRNISFIASNLYDMMMQDESRLGMNKLTFEEIRRVFQKADLVGISIVNLYKALEDYVKKEGHQAQQSAREAREARMKADADAKAKSAVLQKYAWMMEEARRKAMEEENGNIRKNPPGAASAPKDSRISTNRTEEQATESVQ